MNRPRPCGPLCRAPPGEALMIGSARSCGPHEKGGAALTLAGPGVIAAGFALPRDAGRRPALRCRTPSCPQGYAPRREPSQRLGSLPPRPCGPLCRPEVRRSRASAPSALSRGRRNCKFTATAQRSAFPCLRAVKASGASAEREKTNGSELVRCQPDRGESVKGGPPPFTKRKRPIGTRRRAPPARKGVSIAGAKRRAVSGRGSNPIRS